MADKSSNRMQWSLIEGTGNSQWLTWRSSSSSPQHIDGNANWLSSSLVGELVIGMEWSHIDLSFKHSTPIRYRPLPLESPNLSTIYSPEMMSLIDSFAQLTLH